jgi:EAL domain-containing protein (putative c-di-GMP-specific phosphodiesterase class I)
MLNTDRSERVLLGLKALGVRITLDNLGTGHSSISFLRKLPIDSVKIDRSFIQDASISQGDAAVTAAIIALIQSLKMRVIAGGAETREQLEFVKQKQCDEMQGYLFSKAVPAGEIETMLREGVSLSDCLSNQVLENPI